MPNSSTSIRISCWSFRRRKSKGFWWNKNGCFTCRWEFGEGGYTGIGLELTFMLLVSRAVVNKTTKNKNW